MTALSTEALRPLEIRNLEEMGPDLRLGWIETASLGRVRLVMIAMIIFGSLITGAATLVKPEAGAACGLALGLALLLLRKLEIGAYLVVTVVPILSGLKRGFPIPGLKLTEMLAVGVGLVVVLTLRRVHAVPWSRIEWTILGFVIAYFGIGVYDAHQFGTKLNSTSLGSLIGPLQFFLLYRCIRLLLVTADMRVKALRYFLYASVPVSVLGIMQEAKVPGVLNFIRTITDSGVLAANSGSGYSSFARATGPFPHWTPYAGYLTVVIVLWIACLLEPELDLMPRRRLIVLGLIDTIGLLCSAELSAIVGLLMAMVILAAWAKRLRSTLRGFAVAMIVFAGTAGPLLVSRIQQEYTKSVGVAHNILPQTVQYRFEVWSHQYFPAIGQRPLDGYGVFVPPIIVWPDTESQYITLLMLGGAPLLAAYLVMMGGMGTSGAILGGDRADALRRTVGRAVTCVVIILLPMSAIFPYFQNDGLPESMMVLAGIMMAAVPGHLPATGLGGARSRSFGIGRSKIRRLSAPQPAQLARISGPAPDV